MPSTAQHRFLQATVTSTTLRAAAPISHIFTTAYARGYCRRLSRFSKKPFQDGWRSTSTREKRRPYNRHADGFVYGTSGLPIDLEALFTSKRRQDGSAWITLIDSYLPFELRDRIQGLVDDQSHANDLQPIKSLPVVLSRARQNSQIDILSYLGVYQGRWEAVMWLVRALMEHYVGPKEFDEQSKQMLNLLWPKDEEDLDSITHEPLRVELPTLADSSPNHFGDGVGLETIVEERLQTGLPMRSKPSLDSIMSRGEGHNHDAPMLLGYQSLGQIWQGLATTILQAADHLPDDPKYSIIMTQVFRILGYLHRISAFPDTIYNYTPPTDPTVLQRPPTLHLLSRRIMSTLSDVEFSLHWEKEVLKYQEMGYELSKTSVPPRVREFGPELWLDLVLWACVEGGWIIEGAWIVKQMDRRAQIRNKRWSTISWPEICARKEPQLDWTSIIRLQIDRTRLNQVGGIGIATGTDSTVDMGTRTVSREVVLAIMDGMLNVSHSHESPYGTSSAEVQQSITACKSLLECDHPDLDASLMNSTILRLIENTGADFISTPGVLQRFVDLRRMTTKNGKIADTTFSVHDAEIDDAAAILGLLYAMLYGLARSGNLQGTLMAFMKILDIIDMKRKERIQLFANDLQARAREAEDPDDVIEPKVERNHAMGCPSLSPQIPTSVLVAFLDLLTESKFYSLGKWLLNNDDIDGSVVGPELYADRNLQPALLRFATATADNGLLTKVLERAEPPLSEEVLHTLLRCQLVLGKWSKVREILHYFQRTTGVSWKDSDAMAIASTILQLERDHPDTNSVRSISDAQNILSDLIAGNYNSRQDPSEIPDLTEAKIANQLGRIFRTLPDSLRNGVKETSRTSNRAHTSITITPNAFNILLDAMVESYGSMAGKRLWEQWCHQPTETFPKSSPSIGYVAGPMRASVVALGEDLEKEKVVSPTLHMLRNILRPILRIRHRLISAKTKIGRQNGPTSAPTFQAEERETTPSPETRNAEVVSQPLTEQDQDTLRWGVGMYRKFGLTDQEINIEIPGAIPRHKSE